MIRRSIFVLSLFLLLGGATLTAQPMNKPSYETMLEVAKAARDSFDYYHAIEWYEKAYEERKDRELLPILADLHYQIRDYTRSERQYRSILRRDEEEGRYTDLNYNLGRVLKMNGKYDEAEEAFIEFIAMAEDDSLITLARTELEGARMAVTLPDRSRGVEVENAGRDINTRHSEYSPIMGRTGDKVYFSSFAIDEIIQVSQEGLADAYAQILVSQKDEKKGWDEPTPLGDEINRPETHTINVTLSPSGNQMFFVRGEFMSSKLMEGKLFYSTGGDNNWSGAREVEGINGDYIVKNPTVGELFGREVLIFSSDMPGGEGGFDLYYATRESEGIYGVPVNLGKTINTKGDESTPYYFDGTLYFSSTGHPGIGGFDIFFSAWDGRTWTEPENMGKGFNSSANDLYFSIDREGYNGFLVSNRIAQGARSLDNRTCCYDIYSFTIPEVYANLVVGLFTEEKQPLLGGSILLYPYTGNTQEDPNIRSSDKGNRFDYSLDLERYYKVVATAPGYFPDSTTFNTVDVEESKTFEERFYLKLKPVIPAEPEFDTISLEEAIVLENIQFDFDEDRIRDEAEEDLNLILELMNEYPEMKVELSSHTDYRGETDYNIDLSQRRAESTRRWLIRNGIPRDRMEAKGYGETQPFTMKPRQAARYPFLAAGDVLTEEFIRNLPSEEEREMANFLNRRTEFKIIEGPTSIIIKRTQGRKTDALPLMPNKSTGQSSTIPDSIISPMSSLYGQKDLKNVPIMVFEERVIDFGKVNRGDKKEHTFTFVNKGDADLIISLVSACECTESDYSTAAVAPGETGQIHITFDSTEKEESEEVFIDIFLQNEDPRTKAPILERLKYKFELVE